MKFSETARENLSNKEKTSLFGAVFFVFGGWLNVVRHELCGERLDCGMNGRRRSGDVCYVFFERGRIGGIGFVRGTIEAINAEII